MAQCKIGNIAIHVEVLGLLLFLATSLEGKILRVGISEDKKVELMRRNENSYKRVYVDVSWWNWMSRGLYCAGFWLRLFIFHSLNSTYNGILCKSVTTNFVLYRTCYVTLHYNESDCALLGTKLATNDSALLEQKVQPHANIILMTRSIFESIVTVFLCFFIGTWSDKYGRKPIFLSVFGGYTLSYITMIIISSLKNLSPWFYLLRVIPYVLSGGYPIMFATLLSYITDVTSEEVRGVRMGVYEGLLGLSMIIGSTSSSYIFNALGYQAIYSLSATCTILAWLFTFFFVPESVTNINREGVFRNLFRISLAVETIKLTFKKRENYKRAILLLTVFIVMVFMLATFGTSALMFQFLREKFQWSLEQYTLFNSFNYVVILIGSICGPLILHKFFHIREIIIIFFGELSAMLGAIFVALAKESWQIYVATSLKVLAGAVNPMTHCLLSKLVPSEDTGKIFSIITAMQTLTTFVIGSPLYTFIYNNTLTTFPSAFIFVTVGLYIFELIVIGIIYRLQKLQVPSEDVHSIIEESNAKDE